MHAHRNTGHSACSMVGRGQPSSRQPAVLRYWPRVVTGATVSALSRDELLRKTVGLNGR